jgi:hypothetical protein
MDQGTGIGVFQHPQRAIGPLFHIAVAYSPAPGLIFLRAAEKDVGVNAMPLSNVYIRSLLTRLGFTVCQSYNPSRSDRSR